MEEMLLIHIVAVVFFKWHFIVCVLMLLSDKNTQQPLSFLFFFFFAALIDLLQTQHETSGLQKNSQTVFPSKLNKHLSLSFAFTEHFENLIPKLIFRVSFR